MQHAKPKEPANWHDIWALIKPYWFSEQKWTAFSLLFAIIALVLGMVYLNVLLNDWNQDFYNALQNKDFKEFKTQLWRFSYLAFTFVAISIYRVYLTQALEMRWRAWLTDSYLKTWLNNQAYYRVEQTRSADNPDQRIAEDLMMLTRGTLHLSLGLLSSTVSLVSFVGILWVVSGPFTFILFGMHWNIPGYMVWFALLYAGTGSLLVWWVGRPLVGQNFDQQRFEANFRFGLIRIREHAESIALYRGETEELSRSQGRFEQIRLNWWAIMRSTKRLNVVSTFYSQFAIIFPLLVGAPRYFSGALQLGGLMKINSAFSHVQEALSWFIEAFSASGDESLPAWKASVNRLAGFHAAVTAAGTAEKGIQVGRNNVGAIMLDRLSVRSPDGQTLNCALDADIHSGQRILIAGPSGCGKSTLFRALAGIWPYGSGNIEIPTNAKLFFMPQKAYLPIGTLRAAIAYPAAENVFRDLAMRHYLELCQLPDLIQRLDEEDNWTQRLSPGEQQRLAFVRVLLARPDFVFLDEATSAMDMPMEEALYGLLLQELPEAAVVSIAHREAVAKFHPIHWRFVRSIGEQNTIPGVQTNMPYRIEQTR